MASQQDIKRRVRSVRNTRKVTKALELVSGAYLRRSQGRIEALRPYAEGMRDMIAAAAAQGSTLRQPLLERREVRTTAILAMTSDRGLAGAFNAQIVRRAQLEARREQEQGREVRWLAVGRRGVGSLRFRRVELDGEWQGFTRRPDYSDAVDIARALIEAYTEGRVDRVVMVYNGFVSALSQTVEVDEVLPVPLGDEEEGKDARDRAMDGLFLFEPPAEELLGSLLPTALETAVYRALLESAASEHGARMTAMRNASDNAQDLIERLTLEMNRARQAEITQEILEVVAGADALS